MAVVNHERMERSNVLLWRYFTKMAFNGGSYSRSQEVSEVPTSAALPLTTHLLTTRQTLMPDLTRISISFENSLLDAFDPRNTTKGSATRSHPIPYFIPTPLLHDHPN